VFQAFVLGMLLNLGQDYMVSSNRELGYGRYDVGGLPRAGGMVRDVLTKRLASAALGRHAEPFKGALVPGEGTREASPFGHGPLGTKITSGREVICAGEPLKGPWGI